MPVVKATSIKQKSGPKVIKNIVMLNSAEHEFFPAKNVKMPTVFEFLDIFVREHLKFHAQLS